MILATINDMIGSFMPGVSLQNIVDFIIKVFPTLLFIFIVLFSSLLGIIRGFRKSIVLMIQAFVISMICIILYFVLVNIEECDTFILEIINMFLGKNGLQNMLDVSSNCTSIKEIILEFVINNANNDLYGSMIQANTTYLYAIVNLIYHVVFALVLYILYLVLVLLMYIIYLIFYPERRFKRKKQKQFTNGKSEADYHKRRTLGGVVGLARGLISALIVFSFLGFTLYTVTGSTGNGDLDDYQTEDEDYDTLYSAFQTINEYGETGIFQILNTVKNGEDVPYYLFVADLIFQGTYTSPENETATIVLREELSAYTAFVKGSYKLLLKYGDEEFKDIVLNQNGDSNKIMDLYISLIQKPEVQFEFQALISDFTSAKFTVNLLFSLINTIAVNFDSLGFDVDEEISEIFRILFKEGYYSQYIESEKNAIDKTVILPYIKSSMIVQTSDITNIMNLVFLFLNSSNDDTLDKISSAIPYIENLSIFNSTKKQQINLSLARVFNYLSQQYIEVEIGTTTSTKDAYKLSNNIIELNNYDYDQVDWIGELKNILDIIPKINYLSKNNEFDSEDMVNSLKKLFDNTNPKYSENMIYIDTISNILCDSKLIGVLVSTKLVSEMINTSLEGVLSFTFPTNIIYENQYDKYGILLNHGETYYILSCLKIFINNPSILELLDSSNSDINIIESLDEIMNEKYDGNSCLYYLSNSTIIRILLSGLLIDNSAVPLYIPEEALETIENISCINEDEYILLLNSLSFILSDVYPLIKDNEFTIEAADELLKNEQIESMLNSKIIESTIADYLINMLDGNSNIVLPDDLKKPEGWLDDENGELKVLFRAIKASDLSLNTIANGSPDELMAMLENIGYDNASLFLDSKILRNTISTYFSNISFGTFKFIVPQNSLVDGIIIKDELNTMLKFIIDMELSDAISNSDSSALIQKLVSSLVKDKTYLKNSLIISASIANVLEESLSNMNSFVLPQALEIPNDKIEKDNYFNTYGVNSTWYNEIPCIVDAINVIFPSGIDLSMNSDTLNSAINNLLYNYNKINNGKANIDIVYSSLAFRYEITYQIDNYLSDYLSTEVKALAKSNDSTYKVDEIKDLCNIIKSLNISIDNFDFTFNITSFIAISSSINNDDHYLTRGIITGFSHDIIAFNRNENSSKSLKYHPNAFEANGLLKKEELNVIINIIISKNINSFNSSDISFTSNDLSNLVSSSYLGVATASYYLENVDSVKKPNSSFESLLGYNYIKKEEISKVLNVFSILNIDIQNFSTSALLDILLTDLPYTTWEAIASSSILNATIVAAISTCVSGQSLYVIEGTALSNKGGYIDSPYLMLTATELYNFISFAKLFNTSSFNFNITFNSLMSIPPSNLANYINNSYSSYSSIAHALVSELLSDYVIYLAYWNENATYIYYNMYDIAKYSLMNKQLLDSDTCLKIINIIIAFNI